MPLFPVNKRGSLQRHSSRAVDGAASAAAAAPCWDFVVLCSIIGFFRLGVGEYRIFWVVYPNFEVPNVSHSCDPTPVLADVCLCPWSSTGKWISESCG